MSRLCFRALALFFLSWQVLAQMPKTPPLPDIQTAAGRSAARADLSAQRAALEEKYEAMDQACMRRLIVTSCREEVRVQRVDALLLITRQERVLAEIERKALAANAQQKIDEKNSAQTAAQKEKERLAAIAKNERRALERADKARERQERSAQAAAGAKTSSKSVPQHDDMAAIDNRAKKAVEYEQKQRDLAQRLLQREQGLRDLERKQKEKEALKRASNPTPQAIPQATP